MPLYTKKPKKEIKPQPIQIEESFAQPAQQSQTESQATEPLGAVFCQWQAPEFETQQKGSNWLGLWLIVSITAVALAIIFKNFLLALFLALSALMVFFYGFKEPRVLTFRITARGVQIGAKLIPFSEIKSFWILYEPPYIKELLLRTSRLSMAQLIIPIGSENPVKIRRALIDFVPEKEQKQSLIDVLMRLLRF